MKVNGQHYRSLWMTSHDAVVSLINQNRLPFDFNITLSPTWQESCGFIHNMAVRGAGAIGVMAGFAMAQASLQAPQNDRENYLTIALQAIKATRPTARNLFYTAQKVYYAALHSHSAAILQAQQLADENEREGSLMGEHGQTLIDDGMGILTHCNAGWLAFVDYGSALAPIYKAQAQGKNVRVFVDETRPRCQGARLTAWELGNQGIEHYIIADNAAGYYMQKGEIQLVIAGADRIARNGDVANKIGTLEKAILAKEFGVPFYVASPFSTFDADTTTGNDIVIEHRSENEVLFMEGLNSAGAVDRIRVAAPGSNALNPSFDVTPARYITAFITPGGIIKPEVINSTIF